MSVHSLVQVEERKHRSSTSALSIGLHLVTEVVVEVVEMEKEEE